MTCNKGVKEGLRTNIGKKKLVLCLINYSQLIFKDQYLASFNPKGLNSAGV
jgi:hypothetical protein